MDTLVFGVRARGVQLSIEAVEEPAPTLAVSSFLITDAVNLLISLMNANLSDMWNDLAFDIFFLIGFGVAILSLSETVGALLEVPTSNEEIGAFFFAIDCKTSLSKSEPFCNNNYCVRAMFSNDK